MNDVILTLLCFGFVATALTLYILLFENGGAAPSEIRNGIHMLGGLWGLLWWLFESRWVALGVCVAPLLVIALMVRPPAFFKDTIFEKINRRVRALLTNQEEVMEGIFYYALALTLITLALWDNKLIGTAAILALSFGDGIAGIWGRAYGTHFYRFPWGKKKTIEGSAAGFVAAFLSILIVYGSVRGTITPAIVMMAVWGGAAAALAEGASPRATDNFFVPAAVLLILIGIHAF